MLLGLDVGGTHTDAVLIENDQVIASFKAVTDHDNLLSSINRALIEVTKDIDKKKITTINLSTTLSTNAIIQGRLENVGLLVSTGPGISPESYRIGKNYYIIPGSIDHRGTIIKDLDVTTINAALQDCRERGVKVYAAVTKFSTRNPDEEDYLDEKLEGIADFVSLGHKMSSQLNFPRRVNTAYYNSAVWRLYNKFVDAIEQSIKELGVHTAINVLKADGGTLPLSLSRDMPVQTILSGPAASIMGIIALCDITEDSIILDIGGTTTDIAVFAAGAPLIEREGISFNTHPTAVRALQTVSIGIGGDSFINVTEKGITVGPERLGPSMADGGEVPTLIDALNYNKTIAYADVEASRAGIEYLAKSKGTDADKMVKQAIEYAVTAITGRVKELLAYINDRPVYTIHEMLENKKLDPQKVYIMGGPAAGFVQYLGAGFNKEIVIPPNYSVANAIGAALARTTFDIELFADTSRGVCLVPNLDIQKSIVREYSLETAEKEARDYLYQYLKKMDIPVDVKDLDITESSSFKMVEGFFSTGRDIRVKCQIRPGVVASIRQ